MPSAPAIARQEPVGDQAIEPPHVGLGVVVLLLDDPPQAHRRLEEVEVAVDLHALETRPAGAGQPHAEVLDVHAARGATGRRARAARASGRSCGRPRRSRPRRRARRPPPAGAGSRRRPSRASRRRRPNHRMPAHRPRSGRRRARPPARYCSYIRYRLTTRCSCGRVCSGYVPKMRRNRRRRSARRRSRTGAAEARRHLLVAARVVVEEVQGGERRGHVVGVTPSGRRAGLLARAPRCADEPRARSALAPRRRAAPSSASGIAWRLYSTIRRAVDCATARVTRLNQRYGPPSMRRWLLQIERAQLLALPAARRTTPSAAGGGAPGCRAAGSWSACRSRRGARRPCRRGGAGGCAPWRRTRPCASPPGALPAARPARRRESALQVASSASGAPPLRRASGRQHALRQRSRRRDRRSAP